MSSKYWSGAACEGSGHARKVAIQSSSNSMLNSEFNMCWCMWGQMLPGSLIPKAPYTSIGFAPGRGAG